MISGGSPSGLEARQAILWVLAGAAALRVGAFVALDPMFDYVATGVIHGSGAYDAYARNLLATGVYGVTAGVPDAVQPPLYSGLVAVLYAVAGRGALQLVLLHTVLDLVTILSLRRIGSRLFPRGAVVGTLAGAFVAAYPYLVFQSLTLVDTALFNALLYGFIALVIELKAPHGPAGVWRASALAGVALGLATLTRPILAPLAALVGMWLALTLGWRAAAVRLVPVAIATAVIVVPWVGRNSSVYGTFVPVSTNGGSNFWQGNNADSVAFLRAGYDVQWTTPGPVEADERLGPEADRELFNRALDYLRANPAAILELAWTKLLVQWSVDVTPRLNPSVGQALAPPGSVVVDHADDALRLSGLRPTDPVAAYSTPFFDRLGRRVHRAYWGSLFVLGLVGIAMTARSWPDVSLVLAVPVALTVVYVVFHPSTRYRAPGDPAWFLFSAVPVAWALTRLYGWRGAARPAEDAGQARAAREPGTGSGPSEAGTP